jgi:hypothetical protein
LVSEEGSDVVPLQALATAWVISAANRVTPVPWKDRQYGDSGLTKQSQILDFCLSMHDGSFCPLQV